MAIWKLFKRIGDIEPTHPWEQYRILLSPTATRPRLPFLYWLLRFDFFPILASIIFYLYHPPKYNFGPYQSIFTNFIWWLYIFGIASFTVLTIQFIWAACFGFKLKDAYKDAAPKNKDKKIYLVILHWLIFTFFGATFLNWMDTWGEPMRPDDFFYVILIMLVGAPLASDVALDLIQHTIHRVFLCSTGGGKIKKHPEVTFVAVLAITMLGLWVALYNAPTPFTTTSPLQIKNNYKQWVLNGKPQEPSWHGSMGGLLSEYQPTPQEIYDENLQYQIERLKSFLEKFRDGRGFEHIAEAIQRYKNKRSDLASGISEKEILGIISPYMSFIMCFGKNSGSKTILNCYTHKFSRENWP